MWVEERKQTCESKRSEIPRNLRDGRSGCPGTNFRNVDQCTIPVKGRVSTERKNGTELVGGWGSTTLEGIHEDVTSIRGRNDSERVISLRGDLAYETTGDGFSPWASGRGLHPSRVGGGPLLKRRDPFRWGVKLDYSLECQERGVSESPDISVNFH